MRRVCDKHVSVKPCDLDSGPPPLDLHVQVWVGISGFGEVLKEPQRNPQEPLGTPIPESQGTTRKSQVCIKDKAPLSSSDRKAGMRWVCDTQILAWPRPLDSVLLRRVWRKIPHTQ